MQPEPDWKHTGQELAHILVAVVRGGSPRPGWLAEQDTSRGFAQWLVAVRVLAISLHSATVCQAEHSPVLLAPGLLVTDCTGARSVLVAQIHPKALRTAVGCTAAELRFQCDLTQTQGSVAYH